MPRGVYPRRPRELKRYDVALVERIRAAYAAGATQVEIAADEGVSQHIIFNAMRRNGIKARVAAKRDQLGPNNANWKGDAASYQALHCRLYSQFGRPTKCSECGTEEAKVFDYANLTGNYTDITDYAPMCRSCHWKRDEVEPSLGRVADGIPDWAHRIRALGNAVVPQIPELIGRAILEAEAL